MLVTNNSKCIYCAKCIFVIVVVQIYKRIVILHFNFLFFYVFPKDKEKVWMMVVVQEKKRLKIIKEKNDILMKWSLEL